MQLQWLLTLDPCPKILPLGKSYNLPQVSYSSSYMANLLMCLHNYVATVATYVAM